MKVAASKLTSNGWRLIFFIILLSCHTERDITGTYQTNYPAYGITTTIKLNSDSTFERVLRNDILYDSSSGEYRVLDHKVFFILIWEKTGSYRYTRIETQPKIFRSGRDTVAYQALYFIGNNKLFFGNFESGKKETIHSSKKKSYLKRMDETKNSSKE